MAQITRSAGLIDYLELCRSLGVDAYKLAAKAGVPGAALTDPDLMIPLPAMCQMYEMAAEASGADDFGLRVGELRRLSSQGALALAARNQPTLREVIEVFRKYPWLQNSATSIDLEEVGDTAVLRLNGPAWMGRQYVGLYVALIVRILREFLGEEWRPREVWFTYARPANLESHRRVFGVTPHFDQDYLAVVSDRAILDAPLEAADPDMARAGTRLVELLVADRSTADIDSVRNIIVSLLPGGGCTVERVAERMGMDRRTVHRRLAAEGASFSDLLDEVRANRAETFLTNSQRPMLVIADLLGFSGVSAFAHWFRRRYGCSPSGYRVKNTQVSSDPPGQSPPARAGPKLSGSGRATRKAPGGGSGH
jgi:AraC-like DNA-binding protein